MDDALRTLERRLRAAEGDLALAREYRAALARLDPERSGPALDALQGALTIPSAGAQPWPWQRAGSPWQRVPVSGPPPLLPRGPFAAGAPPALVERWRASGEARWASAAVVLVEVADRALEARCPQTGRLLWSLGCTGPLRARDEIEDTDRTTILPWAVAPWGAVTAGVRFQARLEAPRRGSASWRPRAIERGLPERGLVSIDLAVQVALAPGGAWSSAPPSTSTARARQGEPLADGDLALESWDSDLLGLDVDLVSPGFGVWWCPSPGEPRPATYEVGEGGDGRPWVAPASWDHDDQRPARARVAPPPHALPAGAGRVLAATAFDGGTLLRTRHGQDPCRLWAVVAGAVTPCPMRLAHGDLDELDLVFWDEPHPDDEVERPRWATLVPAGDLLLVQAADEVIALGAEA